MKIGIVCYPSFGGSGVVAAELARGFAERGHRVHVVASAPPSRALPESDDLQFHPVKIPDYPVFEHPPYEHALAATLVDVASADPLDLLHVHYAVPHATSALIARQVLGTTAPRVVVTLHGTDVTRVDAPGARAVTRFAVSAADHVTVPSAYLKDAAQRTFGLDGTPAIEVIPNFVDTARFAPPQIRDRARLAALFDAGPDGPILFHVSNFRPVKRTVDLIDVLAELRRHVPARLVVIGDGPERGATAAHARACGLTDSVRFLGPRPDFTEDIGHADAFLLPSESESFGVAALEALSAGVPVFGYRVGGLPEVVIDGAGALVEPFDTAALARAVLDAVTDPERRTALGRAARAHVLARFERTTVLDRYEACFRRVLG